MPTLELKPEPVSPGKARGFVRRLMDEWGIDSGVADDAELLVTELVTNSIIHARSPVRVEVEAGDGQLEVQVSDESTRQVQLRLPSSDAVTGRGVHLLDQIASDWEVLPRAGGKTVRFRLTTSAASSVSP